METVQTNEMQIVEIEFEPLEGFDEEFEEMTRCSCCGTQGGMKCGCGPRF
jgi:hypothetical protein